MSNEKKIASIRKHGIAAQGRKELLMHLQGTPLTERQGRLAQCYDCMGYYVDGKADCGIPDCPHYRRMPYRGKKADRRQMSVNEFLHRGAQ